MVRYGKKEPEPFFKRILKGYGYYIIGIIMNVWFVTVMIAVIRENLLLKLAVGLAAETVVNGLYFNYAYNAAKLDRDLVKFHGMPRDKFMSAKMAVLVPVFGYAMLVLLVLVKAGFFEGTALGKNGFNYYMLLNLHTLPWISMFTDERTLEHLTWGGIGGLAVLQMIQPAVIAVTYELTMREIDAAEILLYGKNKSRKP